MGEPPTARIDLAFEIKELEVCSVPLNILNPIKGTRLENQTLLSPDEILRTIALFRIILPKQTIRLAGGREPALGSREYEAYEGGANALIAGSFLTTSGKSLKEELMALSKLGLLVNRNL